MERRSPGESQCNQGVDGLERQKPFALLDSNVLDSSLRIIAANCSSRKFQFVIWVENNRKKLCALSS